MRAILTGDATLLLSVSLSPHHEAMLTRPEHLAAADATVEQVTALPQPRFDLSTICRSAFSENAEGKCSR
jgi:hypothetical protein